VGAISTALTGSLRRGARYSESRFADRRSPAAVNLQSGTFPESAVAPRTAPRERVLVGPGQVSNRPPGPNPSHLPTYHSPTRFLCHSNLLFVASRAFCRARDDKAIWTIHAFALPFNGSNNP